MAARPPSADELALAYPQGEALPPPGRTIELQPGLLWVRMGLPFALDHINLWLLRDEVNGVPGWTAVDCGIDNPATLPPINPAPQPTAAAPGLAAMIEASARGDMQAFAALANMAEQMVRAGGDMARLGGNMRRLIDGERNPKVLTKGMGPLGKKLMQSLLEELSKSPLH